MYNSAHYFNELLSNYYSLRVFNHNREIFNLKDMNALKVLYWDPSQYVLFNKMAADLAGWNSMDNGFEFCFFFKRFFCCFLV